MQTTLIRRLVLDAKKLKDGQTYTIRSEIWEQTAEASFVAMRPKVKAPAKAKAKSRTK